MSAGELPPDVALLLAAERAAAGPSDVERERMRARVEQTLGLAIGAAAGAAGGAAASAAGGKVAVATGKVAAIGWQSFAAHLVVTKIVIAVAATGGVVSAGYVVTRAVEARHNRAHAHEHRAHRGALPGALAAHEKRAGGRGSEALDPLADVDGVPALDLVGDVAPVPALDPVAAPADAPISPTAPTAAIAQNASQAPNGALLRGPAVAPGAPVAGVALAPKSAPTTNTATANAPAANTTTANTATANRGASTRIVAPGAPAVAAHAHHSSLAAERKLVARARTALLADDFDVALEALDRHAHLYPRGQLAEERDSLRVRALSGSGDHTAARALADEFARAHPGSLFLPSVRAATAH